MLITIGAGFSQVKLSRRNLLSLLHKLDMPGSARTLVKTMTNGHVLYVEAEEDAGHYGDAKPGPMHPATEQFIKEHK